jgi:hypothetical protein
LTIPAGSDGSIFAACDAGDVASGGGFSTYGEPGTLEIYEARPDGATPGGVIDDPEVSVAPAAYLVRAANRTSLDAELQAWVICLDVPD